MTKRSAKDVTGRERPWTALPREQRWSETDLKSKVGVRWSEGEEREGEETLAGISPGGGDKGG